MRYWTPSLFYTSASRDRVTHELPEHDPGLNHAPSCSCSSLIVVLTGLSKDKEKRHGQRHFRRDSHEVMALDVLGLLGYGFILGPQHRAMPRAPLAHPPSLTFSTLLHAQARALLCLEHICEDSGAKSCRVDGFPKFRVLCAAVAGCDFVALKVRLEIAVDSVDTYTV